MDLWTHAFPVNTLSFAETDEGCRALCMYSVWVYGHKPIIYEWRFLYWIDQFKRLNGFWINNTLARNRAGDEKAQLIQSIQFGVTSTRVCAFVSWCLMVLLNSVRLAHTIAGRCSIATSIYGVSIKINFITIYGISNGLCLFVWFLSINASEHERIWYLCGRETSKWPAIIN